MDFVTIPSGQYIQQRKQDFFPVLDGMHFEPSISGREDLQSPVFPPSARANFSSGDCKGVFISFAVSHVIFLLSEARQVYLRLKDSPGAGLLKNQTQA